MFDSPSLWGLFLSAFLSSTLLPGGSEAVLAYLTRAQAHELWWLLGVASVGNTLGGMTSWLVGRVIAMRVPLIASDEGRGTSDEEEQNQNQAGVTAGRVRPTHRACGDSGLMVRGTHPTEATGEGGPPRHSSLIPRPSAKADDSGLMVRGTHPTEAMGERVLPRHSSLVPRPSAKAIERLRRWGAPVLLLSWLPIIGDPLCVAAGWLRIHWLLSLMLIGIGKTVRYTVVVFLFM